MNQPNLDVRRIAGALGAEIHGVDLSVPLSPAMAVAIHGAFLEHGVIFFRGQSLTDATLKQFAANYGSFFRHPYFVPEGDPDIVVIRRAPGDTRIVGEGWHSDTPAVAAPPKISILYGEDIPPYGGDTLFANQYLALETLSPVMQRMIANVKGVYSDTKVASPSLSRNANGATRLRDGADYTPSEGVHPIVRTHPDTGRKALYLIRPLLLHFDGMTAEESTGLADFLYDHSHRPEFTCRFRWEPGSLAMWDNRCTAHAALNDTGPFHRLMRRVQLQGDIPA